MSIRPTFFAVFAPVVLVLTQCAHRESTIYYGKSDHTIASIAGSGGEERLFRHEIAHSMAFDPNAELIFKTAGGVSAVGLDGRQKFVFQGINGGQDLAVDPDRGHLYLLERLSSNLDFSRIRRCQVTGECDPAPIIDGILRGHDLAVDARRGKLYWTQIDQVGTYDRGIWQADLDGGNRTRVATSRQSKHVVVDVRTGRIYWEVQLGFGGPYEIWSVNPGKERNPKPVIQGIPREFRDLAVDARGRKIYWAQGEFGDGRRFDSVIKRSNLDGSQVETVIAFPDGGPYASSLEVGFRPDEPEAVSGN
jgi:hypothetical protein